MTRNVFCAKESQLGDKVLIDRYKNALENFAKATEKKEKYANCADYLKKYLFQLNFRFAKEEKEILFEEIQLRRLIT